MASQGSDHPLKCKICFPTVDIKADVFDEKCHEKCPLDKDCICRYNFEYKKQKRLVLTKASGLGNPSPSC
jgi:hypothetical protein